MQGSGGRASVALAHDYLTQRGGAERVVVEMSRVFSDSAIVTALYNPDQTFDEFRERAVLPSWLNVFDFAKRDPRRALPLIPFAWMWRRPISATAVICSSSGWAHGVRTSPRTAKVVYCHNPPRWLYQQADYVEHEGVFVRLAMRLLTRPLRAWDRRAAASADVYLANSTSVADRIRSAYGIEAKVVHPPVVLTPEGPDEPLNIPGPFFVTVARGRGYKGTEKITEAWRGLGRSMHLLVVGGGGDHTQIDNVHYAGRVTDAQLRWAYSHAEALISVSREDFGLTPLEANSFGTPVLVLRRGGFLDTTDEHVSGEFIEDESIEAIRKAVENFPEDWDSGAIAAHAAQFSVDRFASELQAAVERASKLRTRTAI